MAAEVAAMITDLWAVEVTRTTVRIAWDMEQRELCRLLLYRNGQEERPPSSWMPTAGLAGRSVRFDRLEPGTTYHVIVESREHQRALVVTTAEEWPAGAPPT
jgi:hypothetical protein